MAYLHTAQEISDPRADLNDVNPEHVFATVQFGRSYFAVHTAAEAEAFAAAFAEAARLLREAHGETPPLPPTAADSERCCGKQLPGGKFRCTVARGHSAVHVAYDSTGYVCAVWEDQ